MTASPETQAHHARVALSGDDATLLAEHGLVEPTSLRLTVGVIDSGSVLGSAAILDGRVERRVAWLNTERLALLALIFAFVAAWYLTDIERDGNPLHGMTPTAPQATDEVAHTTP